MADRLSRISIAGSAAFQTIMGREKTERKMTSPIFNEFSKAAMDRRVFNNICNVYQFMNGVTFALPRKEVIV